MSLKETLSLLIEAKDLASDKFKAAAKEARELDQAVDGVGGRFDSVKTKAAGFGSAAASGATLAAPAIGAMGVQLFRLGADLEQVRGKAEIVFGPEQIGQVDAWAKSTANSLGLTSSEAVGLAANMSDLLIPMGFTREQAVGMSTDVIGLSGALAAWSGGTRSAAEVAEILNAAMLGEREQLKGLGISITAADVAQRLMEKGQKELTGTALQQAEAQATVELIFEKSKDAQAAFADETKTTNEQIAEQSAKLRELRDAMSGFVHGALTDYATWALAGGEDVNGFWGDYNDGIDKIVTSVQKWKSDIQWLVDTMETLNTLNPTMWGVDFVKGLLPGRANGGPVSGGSPYMVGERGPEMFVPQSSGSIVPNHRLGSGGGGDTYQIYQQPGESPEDLVARIVQYKRRNGSLPF